MWSARQLIPRLAPASFNHDFFCAADQLCNHEDWQISENTIMIFLSEGAIVDKDGKRTVLLRGSSSPKEFVDKLLSERPDLTCEERLELENSLLEIVVEMAPLSSD
ncbi:hypothetical protein [Rhizobium binae]|uniref:hypothetical protein n=1 Tax=Rhizobium binae TaxID=1138190 RepID=UPI001C83210A|nr:hypothetical protein [Rhizobium binae]MBX4967869.1 hypothetical protein [Rhizobium binae]